jgi:hypothetical protein
MVAGAAALLRIAAPGAPIRVIQSALLNGARPGLARSDVAYGSLDVACSLHWLYARRQQGWDMIPIASVADNAGYADFAQATSGCSRSPRVSVSSLAETTSETYAQASEPVSASVSAVRLGPAQDSNSNRWAAMLLQGAGAAVPAYRPVFPIARRGFSKPKNPLELTTRVYRLGLVSVGCPADGYVITGVNVAFASLIKPHGWVFPTDESAPVGRLQLGVVVDRPWWQSLLPRTLKVNVSARCEYNPPATQ